MKFDDVADGIKHGASPNSLSKFNICIITLITVRPWCVFWCYGRVFVPMFNIL